MGRRGRKSSNTAKPRRLSESMRAVFDICTLRRAAELGCAACVYYIDGGCNHAESIAAFRRRESADRVIALMDTEGVAVR